MVDTTEIRRLLKKVTDKSSGKSADRLVCLVSELCTKYDEEPGVLEIIHKNQESIETTFSFIKSLRG